MRGWTFLSTNPIRAAFRAATGRLRIKRRNLPVAALKAALIDQLHVVCSITRHVEHFFQRLRRNMTIPTLSGLAEAVIFCADRFVLDCHEGRCFQSQRLFMLVLTRQEGEKICIGDKIIVEVTHNGSDRVRLGIDAPPDKIVLRGEILVASVKETAKAATDVASDSVVPVLRCG